MYRKMDIVMAPINGYIESIIRMLKVLIILHIHTVFFVIHSNLILQMMLFFYDWNFFTASFIVPMISIHNSVLYLIPTFSNSKAAYTVRDIYGWNKQNYRRKFSLYFEHRTLYHTLTWLFFSHKHIKLYKISYFIA